MDNIVSSSLSLQQRYSHGMCDALALALHRRYGFALGLAGKVEQDDGETFERPFHAFVYRDGGAGWIVDVHGERLVEELLMDLGQDPFESQPVPLWHRPASVQEVSEAFTTLGVSEEDVKRAERDLPALGLDQLRPNRPPHSPVPMAVPVVGQLADSFRMG